MLDYELKQAARHAGMLRTRLQYRMDMSDVVASLEKREQDARLFEQSTGGRLDGRIKIGVLTAAVDPSHPLSNHLVMHAAQYTQYQDIRDRTVNMCRAQKELMELSDGHLRRAPKWRTNAARRDEGRSGAPARPGEGTLRDRESAQ